MRAILTLLAVPALALLAPAAALPAAAQRSERAVVALDPGLAPFLPGKPVSGRLAATTGMDSVERMFDAWVAAFRVHHPGADLSIVQKAVAPEERIALGPDTDEVFHPGNDAYEDRYGYDPFRIRVCQAAFVLQGHVSAIGVFVGKGNPLNEIALDKLDAAFSDARRRGYPAPITTWGQLGLGGEWADKPVKLLGFYWRDDVTWYFRDMVSYGAPFKSGYRVPGTGGMERRIPAIAKEMMATLASDPTAIGFANFSYASDGVKPLALIDEHGVVGQPSLGDIASGRYALQRSLYIYVNRKPGTPLPPLVKEFLSFILSRDGQALVTTDHYLPLTARMVAEERAKLD